MIRTTIVATVLMLSGCSGSASDEQAPAPVALVVLVQAEKGAIPETVTLYGVVEISPAAQHVLPAPTEAVVKSIDAPAGTRVQRGQVIAQLMESPATRLELARAASDAHAADQAYARAQRLRADGLVGNSELETAHAAALSADATRDSLISRRESLNLRAPAAGYVATITPSRGDIVASGSAVATIAQVGDVRAHFGIDSAFVRRIASGASLVIAPSAGGAPINSQILSVSPIIDAQTKLASVFASIPPNTKLNAGVPLTAALSLDLPQDTLTIPYSGLLNDGGQPYVFVVVDGVAHRQDVVIGAAGRDRIAIVKGVKVGDHVITDGGTAVEDGMKVRVQ
jgi:RND family efflux transporter MFP subunit